eukprot:4115080-Pyramimonas_sp.AAC.1
MSEHKPRKTFRRVRSPPGPCSVSQNLAGTPIAIAARPTPPLPLKQSARYWPVRRGRAPASRPARRDPK